MIYAIFNHGKQMRLCHKIACKLRKVPVFGKFLATGVEYFIRIYFSSDISSSAQISADVTYVHGQNIVIGGCVKIGRRCKIFNGVTLGNKDTEAFENGQPSIGDDCVISTGAKLLGPIKIGNRVIIGANAVVLSDIPDDSIAVGVPAKIKNKKSVK